MRNIEILWNKEDVKAFMTEYSQLKASGFGKEMRTKQALQAATDHHFLREGLRKPPGNLQSLNTAVTAALVEFFGTSFLDPTFVDRMEKALVKAFEAYNAE